MNGRAIDVSLFILVVCRRRHGCYLKMIAAVKCKLRECSFLWLQNRYSVV